MIVSGSASQSLAAALSAETGRALASVSYERFPDGEQLVTVHTDADRAVVVGATPTDASLVELLLLQDAAREAGAGSVVTVLPYMGYTRQDAAFEPGQAVSARVVARAIGTGTDRVVVVNPHASTVCDHFGVTAEALDAAGRLAEALPGDLESPLFLAPDENAQALAGTVRDAYGRGETDHFVKTRRSGTDVEIEPSDADVKGRDVVVVDDIIATGGTMSAAIGVLNDRGAGRVFAAGVHLVLAGSARTRLAAAGVEAVVGTDTLERAESAVTVAPTVADAL